MEEIRKLLRDLEKELKNNMEGGEEEEIKE